MEDLDILRELRNRFAFMTEGFTLEGDRCGADWARARLAWSNAEIARRIAEHS
jgi:hypothetical protein